MSRRYLSEKRSKVWLHSCEGGRCESSISAMSASVLNSVWYSACSAKAFSSSEPKLDSRQRPYSGAEQRQPGTEPLTERAAERGHERRLGEGALLVHPAGG